MISTSFGSLKVVRLGLIGLGRWARNYLSTINRMPGVEVVCVAGRDHQQAILEDFPGTSFTNDWRKVCLDSSLDGIIVATSPESHFEITKYLIEANIPALVEKPFTLSAEKTDGLYSLATDIGSLCMVNYIHLFSPGFRDLKSRVRNAGRIEFIVSENVSPGPYRVNVPVLWDWGCHELAMCIDLLDELPDSFLPLRQVQTGPNASSEIFELRLRFKPDIAVLSTFGNAAEFKRRDFCVVCENGVFVYDGLSDGLAKQYSQVLPRVDFFGRQTQASPLECAIAEFLVAINLGQTQHRTLKLAMQVNQILSKL